MANTAIDLQALKWEKWRFDNWADQSGEVNALNLVAGWLDPDDSPDAFAKIDSERFAFRYDYGGKSLIIVATIDYDGAPDGRSQCTRVEVREL